MTYADQNDANRIRLGESDRELEDQEQDIRGWPVEGATGNRVGTVEDLLLNTETELVDVLILNSGEAYLIDAVRIGDGVVYLGGVEAEDDELTVRRSEEELRAGTRERQAGEIKVRKRVTTDQEEVRVPKKREEVNVERVPVEEGEAPQAEIGDDEVSIPVTEEEVIVEKRPVVKEEIRIRKDVVEDEEVVEEDVRREEVDIEDGGDTGR